MRYFFGSIVHGPSAIARFIAAARNLTVRDKLSVIRILTAFVALLICSTHALVAGANTAPAAAFGYLCLSLVMFGCAASFWTRARSSSGTLYIRWSLISAGALSAAIGYFPSSLPSWFDGVSAARQFQTACFNASEALFMLAAVLFFAGVSRSIVIVDILQALMFTVLRFNIIYSPATRYHFRDHHLLIGQLVALYLFLVALVACLGAASRAELRFLRTLSCFLGLRLVAFFTANQVSYVWLRYEHCSLWDLPGETLLAGFALYLLFTDCPDPNGHPETMPLREPSLMVRSLMPSFLALVNLMLGLIVLRISLTLAAIVISISLVCYVVRTVLLHAHAMHEKATLQIRNEHLEGLAVRDPLTGIGNRRSLAATYSRLQSLDGDETLSLLLMDIDHFKQANDRHGHLHGDRVLVVLAKKLERLASSVPASHCARFGGDEFAILLVNVSPEKASMLAEELRSSFHDHDFEAANATVSLSIGVAPLRAVRDLPLESLISYADQALYRAKLLGRNRVEVQPSWHPDCSLEHLTPPPLNLELSPAAD